MGGSAILVFERGDYLRLVEEFPPVKIRTAKQAQATVNRIEELMALPRLSPAAAAYVDLLSDLLADWEDATEEIPDIHGVDLVRALLEDRGLHQKDLVGVFATESVASEVLRSQRELSRKHIEGLARFFGVSPSAFFSDSDLTASGTYKGERKRTATNMRLSARIRAERRRTSANVRGGKKPRL